MIDAFHTITAASTGEFKDRGSKFLGFAFPIEQEEQAMHHLETLRKAHFKANHHCFAWRIGTDGQRFRANDDGEPSGTAGRPILGQIDAFGITNVLVVVVRYFGGTLLGASGLIHAYRETASETLKQANIEEQIIKDICSFDFDYALMPDLMQALKKQDLNITEQIFNERGLIRIAIRKTETTATLVRLKAALWKVSLEEAETLEWPAGLIVA